MIQIKNKEAIRRMTMAGSLLAEIFEELVGLVQAGVTTSEVDAYIALGLKKRSMTSATKGYMGYNHVCCISINDEVVHGVPSASRHLETGDLVKVDVCASWKGYCADMARPFFIGATVPADIKCFIDTAQYALDAGIAHATVGSYLTDISAAIQGEVEKKSFGIIRDFAGHGIGKRMHEDPEVLNYGKPGRGPVLRQGMALAIEPMVTMGHYDVHVIEDGWTVKTVDGRLATHVEDTVIVTENGPKIVTRNI